VLCVLESINHEQEERRGNSMNATPQQKNLLALGTPIHEVIHGEVLLEIINSQNKVESEYQRGYSEAMQKVYALVYALVFEQADQKKEVAHGN